MTDAALIQQALAVRNNSYSPYSEFAVSAAILTESGKVFTGVNVENASYGLTICAERVAVATAVTEGERNFEAIAVVVKGGGSPCGACRQVLYEFAPHLRVLISNEDGELLRTVSVGELLPDAFGPQSL